MSTIELNNNYDVVVTNGNLSIQRDELSVIRQNILNKLSLIKGECTTDSSLGLNIDIMFDSNVPNADKVAEIKRVIYTEARVVSVDNVVLEVDTRTRVGYFTCYITVSLDNGATAQTTINFGV